MGAGRELGLASPRPLGSWLRVHANLSGAFPWCWGGALRTTRQRLLVRPRAFYRHLASQLNAHSEPEAGHYAERAAFWIFGGATTCGISPDSLELRHAAKCW